MRSISASPEIRIIVWVAARCDFWSPSASCQRVSRFYCGVEFHRIAPLLARSEVRAFAAAKRRVIIDPGRRQVDHRHADLGIALEVRRVLEARGADPGA